MKKLFWIAVGIWAGTVGVKKLRENERYAELLDRAGSVTKDLKDAVVDGFKERETEIKRERRNEQA
ncbi:MAG: hypothetical protein RL149_188 [Actinomycetota bacterium]